MNFADVKQDTPRLVIMYNAGSDKIPFSWGVLPGLPLPHLIGYITRVQVAISNGVSGLMPCEGHKCEPVTFVIAWDGESFDWWAHESIPVDALIGMLETIKTQLVSGTTMQRSVSQGRQLLGPDGQPFRMR